MHFTAKADLILVFMCLSSHSVDKLFGGYGLAIFTKRFAVFVGFGCTLYSEYNNANNYYQNNSSPW